MIMRDGGVTILIILLAAAAIGLGAKVVFQEDDHPLEEVAEEVIKSQTGIDIDLTPDSKEE